MSIRADEKTGFFYLETKNTSYQMKVDKYRVLRHIWYGAKTNCSMDYLFDYPDCGFSGNIYEAEGDRTYSLDTMLLEYPTEGGGDYRISAISAVHHDGTNALDLRYSSFEIKKGKYSIPSLPSVYADDDDAETLEITMKDSLSGIEVILKYGVIEKYDIITRSSVIINKGASAVMLKKAFSLSLDIPPSDLEWVHFHGKHAMERMFERRPLLHGIQESSSKRGTSSHQQNPSVLLCEKDCTETHGNCFGALLVYSGGFQTKAELDQLGQTRLLMGINPETFTWKLNENDSFFTPEAILSFSGEGFSLLSQNFHNIIRNNVCRGKYKLANRPVLINNWEATYFDFDEEKLLNIAKQAAILGVDMLVTDDGWFGKRDDDTSGLGDWFVNEKKLKGGLKPLVEKINALGLKFGIWFEPEMISEDSNLFKEHPDFAISIPSRKPTRSRFQLVLDMTKECVRDYLFDRISSILKSANISYVKWDMNRSICDWYSSSLSPETMGEMPHRYVLGVYDLLERLTSEFPDVLFEGCSGGGGRFDAGMLYYSPQIWCSDNTDAYERTIIQYGTSFFYPISAVGSHVSAVPNHQSGRVTSIEARAAVAMAGSFGYELDLSTLSDEEKELVKKQIKRFKKYNSLISGGRYYRLSNPLKDKLAAWEFVSESGDEILVSGIIFRSESNSLRHILKLSHLSPEKKYRLDGSCTIYSGKALCEGGILLPKPWGDYFPIELHFTEVL